MQIAILLFDQFNALDAIGPAEVFCSTWEAQVFFVAEQAGRIRNDTGMMSLDVNHTLDTIPKPDIVVVPGGLGLISNLHNERVLAWLRSAYSTASWITSIGSGSLLLGAAGLLQGEKATTCKNMQADLEGYGATYVHKHVKRSGKIVTAAGCSAGIEMALYIVKNLADAPYAQAVQNILDYDSHPTKKIASSPRLVEDIYHWMIMKQRLENIALISV